MNIDEKEKEKRELEQQRMKRFAAGPASRFINMSEEKASDFKGSLRRLLGYLKKHIVLIIASMLVAIASTFLTALTPKILAQIMDIIYNGYTGVSSGIDYAAIRHICLLLVLIYVVSVAFNLVQQIAMIIISQEMVYTMRRQISEKLARLPLSYFDNNTRGDILSRVSNDVENIAQTLQQSITQILTAIVTIVAVLVFMFSMSLFMTGISLISVGASVLITMLIAKKAKQFFRTQWSSTGSLNGQIEEMYTGHSIVKLFNQQQAALVRFDAENERLTASSFKAQFISGIIMPATTVINNFIYVIICVVGGVGIVNGTITLGSLTAIISYSKQLSQPINSVATIMSTIQSTLASAERVFQLLDATEETSDASTAKHLENPKGVIEFNDVSFSYKPDTKLIEHLNLKVAPGDKVAIVGPTGAGKTTLVNLLMRFYEIDDGSISIDGVDIRELERENLRSHIGMVLQDAWLFNGSIRDNIAYGFNPEMGEPAEEAIIAAAKMAYVDHFVKTLTEGYDTVINDDATNISQGQKQLMTIARAFLSEPSILILDEATSSVDTRTEVLIQKAMQKLMENRTSFVIAHRLSTIRDADTILVMNNGTIIEQGNHESLLAAKGFYYDLYNSQFTSGSDQSADQPAETPAFAGGRFPGGGPSGMRAGGPGMR